MTDILFQYHRVNPTTWFFFSSLLSIALFFKFNRLWSIRNLDLLGRILLAPGILAVEYGGYKANVADQQLGLSGSSSSRAGSSQGCSETR